MAYIGIPSSGNVLFRLDSADFPDASTAPGQTAINAAVAALNPSPPYVSIQSEEVDQVTVSGVDYPFTRIRTFTSLSSWYATL